MKPGLWPALSLFLVTGAGATEGTPLPLDPLTKEEASIAERVAGDDRRVQELVGANRRLIYVQFISVKLKDGADEAPKEPAGRYAEVMFHVDPDRGGVRALVDLTAHRVVDAVRVPEQSVPIGPSDVELATRIALADGTVRRLLGDRADSFRVLTGSLTAENAGSNYVEGLRTIGVAPSDPCTKHRCVILLFSSDNRYILDDQQITVDLTTKKTTVVPRDQPRRPEGGTR